MTERILVTRIARTLQRGKRERYTFPISAEARIRALLESSARSGGAEAEIGGVLKLVHVLRTVHESPTAAAWLADLLKEVPDAMRVVSRHWRPEQRQPRPRRRHLAPHVDSAAPPGTMRVSSLQERSRRKT